MAKQADLKIRLLGEMEVLRDGAALALPRSKKTRALLAFLVATGRAHRRDRLCSLFWDVPDDPRGSLRWSLSKLRPLLDDPQQKRIVADRESVCFDPLGAEVDLTELRRRAAGGLDQLEAPQIESLAQAFGGAFLEGLDLASCLEFQAWCVAEREEANALQTKMLRVLVDRLAGDPNAALPHVRRLAQLNPHDEALRLELIRLLAAAGRRGEAEQHYRAGRTSLIDTNPGLAAELDRIWNDLRQGPAAAARPAPERAAGPGETRPHLEVWGPLPLPEKPSIAVLPFEQANGAGDDYFRDGIARDLGTVIAHIDAFFVVAPSSAAAFQGQQVDAREVASRLGVRYVVDGALQRSAKRLSVTARLHDGLQGGQIWVKEDARPIEDIIALQNTLCSEIVATIGDRTELPDLTAARPASFDAWDILQKGLWHLYRRTADDMAAALELFRSVSEVEPHLAQPYAASVDAYYYQVALDFVVPNAAWREHALGTAQTAIDLAPDAAAAHCAMGQARIIMRRHDAAVPAFETATRINPNFAWAHYGLGAAHVFAGQAEKAIPSLRQAIRLSPYDRHMGSFLLRMADAHLFIRHYDQAVEWAQQAIRQPFFQWSRHAVLLSALGHLGRTAEAKEALDELLRRRPDFSLELVRGTHLYTDQVQLEFVGEPQLFKDQDQFAHYLDGLVKAGVPLA